METFNYLINIVFSSLVTIYFFLVPFGGFLSVFLGLIYLTANSEKRQKLQSLGLLSLVI